MTTTDVYRFPGSLSVKLKKGVALFSFHALVVITLNFELEGNLIIH